MYICTLLRTRQQKSRFFHHIGALIKDGTPIGKAEKQLEANLISLEEFEAVRKAHGTLLRTRQQKSARLLISFLFATQEKEREMQKQI